jgi:hypothetical protein
MIVFWFWHFCSDVFLVIEFLIGASSVGLKFHEVETKMLFVIAFPSIGVGPNDRSCFRYSHMPFFLRASDTLVPKIIYERLMNDNVSNIPCV